MRIDKTFLPLILFLILVLVLGWVLSHESVKQAVVMKEIPAFSLPDLLTDEPIDNAALDQPWTLVNIWATWCSPCKQEHTLLLSLSKQIPIVGINFKDEPAFAKAWIQEKGNPYTHILSDATGRTVFNWGAVGVPETLLIDQQGVIHQRHMGLLTQAIWDEQFLPIIEGR